MKSITLLLLSMVFIALTLCSKLSYAAAEKNSAVPPVLNITHDITRVYIFPNSYAAGKAPTQYVTITNKAQPQTTTQAIPSKNQFFNFATKFNDKLQQFIAFFKHPQLVKTYAKEAVKQYITKPKEKSERPHCDNKINS